ncbi:MAG TPA: nucleoside-diphosphate kinase, partial [Phycisphaerae bacterium]|nr:nucleoside-diphosphate kinase [Phycisphaerae bacterium]
MERTLIILKPDCVQRRLIGTVIQRFEQKGLTIAAMKLMQITRELAEQHYAVHKGKPFYPGLIEYITSGPVVVMVIAGPNASNPKTTQPRPAAPTTRRKNRSALGLIVLSILGIAGVTIG